MTKDEIYNKIIDLMYYELSDYNIEDIFLDVKQKNNGLMLKGLNVKLSGRSIMPCVYEDFRLPGNGMDDEYTLSDEELQEIARGIAKDVIFAIDNIPQTELLDVEKIVDRNRIIATLINYEKNREYLSDKPHIRYLDLAIVFRLEYLEYGCHGTAVIDDRILEQLDIDIDELYQIAMNNQKGDFNPVIEKLNDLMGRIAPLSDYDKERIALDDVPIYVVTNEKNLFGAAAILNKNVQKDLENIINENYYLIPASIHEFIVVPCEFERDSAMIKDLIRDINNDIVDFTDILSYSLYYYDCTDKLVHVC